MDEKTIARFWAKVDKNGPVPEHMPHLGPCWVWIAGRRGDGYGAFATPGYRQFGAHRFSYLIHFTDPGRLLVLHECDNISCVNPSHLRLGTNDENMADMVRKLRSNHGASVNTARLTEVQVREVARRYSAGESSASLAIEFGIAQANIQNILAGKTWKHLGIGRVTRARSHRVTP